MMTSERGFTIIEILVAVMILSIGVLGLASTAALVTRMIGQGQRYSEASTLASERFELMRSIPCDALTSGTETVRGYQLTWRSEPVGGNRGRDLFVTATVPTPGAPRSYTFTSTRMCI